MESEEASLQRPKTLNRGIFSLRERFLGHRFEYVIREVTMGVSNRLSYRKSGPFENRRYATVLPLPERSAHGR